MPKTKTLEILEKTFVIRDFPLRLIDWVQVESMKLKDIEGDLKAKRTMGLEHQILKNFVVDPVIDDQYLEDEAGLEEFSLVKYIMGTILDIKEEIKINVKKKPAQ
jgi:hypothetical protein